MIKFYIFLRPNGGSFFGCYIMATFSNFKQPEKEQKFVCKLCDFSCSKKANYTRHLDTEKHKMALSATLATDESSEKPQKEQKSAKLFRCDICDKGYKDKTGLWRHKKKCGVPAANLVCQNAQPVSETSSQISPELVLQVLEKNKELTEVVMEQNKTIMELSKNSQIQTQNNMNNCHNNTFNLQFFLNETCKDAMNIQDFIKSLQLSVQDLESVGELGYAEGISRMFVRGLKDMEVTKRPIHCSDLKREVIHIKDKDRWEKDNPNQDKLKRAIKDLSNKNIMLFDDWQKENPGYDQYDNKKNDIYLKMMVQAMGPPDEPSERRDFGKIVRSIARNTIIDKSP